MYFVDTYSMEEIFKPQSQLITLTVLYFLQALPRCFQRLTQASFEPGMLLKESLALRTIMLIKKKRNCQLHLTGARP